MNVANEAAENCEEQRKKPQWEGAKRPKVKPYLIGTFDCTYLYVRPSRFANNSAADKPS